MAKNPTPIIVEIKIAFFQEPDSWTILEAPLDDDDDDDDSDEEELPDPDALPDDLEPTAVSAALRADETSITEPLVAETDIALPAAEVALAAPLAKELAETANSIAFIPIFDNLIYFLKTC